MLVFLTNKVSLLLGKLNLLDMKFAVMCGPGGKLCPLRVTLCSDISVSLVIAVDIVFYQCDHSQIPLRKSVTTALVREYALTSLHRDEQGIMK